MKTVPSAARGAPLGRRLLDTDMSEVVRPEGWHQLAPRAREDGALCRVWTTGPGARPGARVPWARPLTAAEATALTVAAVLGGADRWEPASAGSVVVAAEHARPPAVEPTAACPPPARFERDVEYARPGGESLRLDACTPAGKGPFPAALLVHGGGWISGDRTQAARALVHPLTKAGIAWLALSYRLAPRHTYPAPVEDVLAAVRWTRKNARRLHVDAQRLALFGESAGGHLVVDAAVRAGDDARVAAVVPFFAPVDLESDTDRRGGLRRPRFARSSAAPSSTKPRARPCVRARRSDESTRACRRSCWSTAPPT